MDLRGSHRDEVPAPAIRVRARGSPRVQGLLSLSMRKDGQFLPGQVCDRCKAKAAGVRRCVLAWLGHLATYTLAWMLALWITHLLGFSWRT